MRCPSYDADNPPVTAPDRGDCATDPAAAATDAGRVSGSSRVGLDPASAGDVRQLQVFDQHVRANEAWAVMVAGYTASAAAPQGVDASILLGLHRMFEQHREYMVALAPRLLKR